MRIFQPLLLSLMLLSSAACSAHHERMASFRQHYAFHEFNEADAEVNRLIASEFGESEELVKQTNGLAAQLQPENGDRALLLQEKAMTRLALGDVDGAQKLLLRTRAQMDAMREESFRDWANSVGAALTDDNALPYRAAAYDHVMLRTLLCITELLKGGSDAYAYALQIGEAQEAILGSSFQVNFDDGTKPYRPADAYRRVGIGAYLQGVIRESELQRSEAVRAYERFLAYEPTLAISKELKARLDAREWAPEGYGVVHVFYFGGRGPELVEAEEVATGVALKIASIVASIATRTSAAIFQKTALSTPSVKVNQSDVPPLRIQVGSIKTQTQQVLDLNELAITQLEAMKPLILARALVRRATKSVVATGVAKGVGRNGWQELLVGLALNATSTLAERADTRYWGSLPSQVQIARLPLPDGTHTLVLSDGSVARVRITKGYDSYVLALRPNTNKQATVIVDARSRVE